MSKLIKIVAGLAFVAAAMAAPGPTARADLGQDQEFYRLLTEPDQTHPMVIWNFPEVRAEGIGACEREDAGEAPFQALTDLEYPNGPYTFDNASAITSAAEVIYCPWHGGRPGDSSWINNSAPVYPRPLYPSIAWYPAPTFNGGGA
jgi:hypothetical protein